MRAFFAQFRFLLGYTAAIQKSQSHSVAVQAGLTKLAEKKPFNILTPDDIKLVVPVWSLIHDPKTLGALVANIVREKSVDGLKNRVFLEQLAKKYREINKGNPAGAAKPNRGRR